MTNENTQNEYHCDACGLPANGPSRVVIVPGFNGAQIIHTTYDPTPEIENLRRQVETLREAVESTVPPEMMEQVDAKVMEYLSRLDAEGDYRDN